MKKSDIDPFPAKEHVPRGSQYVRLHAPELLASVINDTHALKHVSSLDDLRPEHIEALGGGVDAATYFIKHPDEAVVVKLSDHGLDAEAEAIEAWRDRGVRAPKVRAVGEVPVTRETEHPVRYIVQEAMLTPNGRLIETCADYLLRFPKKAREIGRAMGGELAKLHSCVSERTFGEFKDAGDRAPYKTWNAYVVDAFTMHADYLHGLGIEPSAVTQAAARMREHAFVKRGRYLHGDFSIRNMAMKSYDPLIVSVFDPNPLVGDPSWDISVMANNREFHKRRMEYDDTQNDLATMHQQLWIGFKQGYDRTIDKQGLLLCQVVQGIYQAQHAETTGDKIGFRVRKEFLRDAIGQLAA